MNDPRPETVLTGTVKPDWVDYNGHMNDAAYALVFSRAIDAFMECIGLGPETRAATGHTIYTLAIVVRYLRETKLGAPLAVTLRVLEEDGKRMRFWVEMREGGEGPTLATSEQLLICVDQSAGAPRASPLPPEVARALALFTARHAGLPMPPEAGQGIRLRKK